MAARPNQSPSFRLTIDDRMGNDGVGRTVTWNPSNMLHGHMDISCARRVEIRQASVYLEGISRNWAYDLADNGIIMKLSSVERKFLSQTLDISPSVIEPATPVLNGFHIAIPFHFIISRTIAGAGPGLPLHCLQLPPSIELGKVYIDESSGKRFAQPSISYQIRAFVMYTVEGQDQASPAEIHIPILFMPYTEELPPTDTTDFCKEFILQESRVIRWSSFGRNLGAMIVSMQEPRALTYDTSSTGASTEGWLNIEIEPTGRGDICQSLQAISFTVLSLIQIKTFYSIKAFPRLPSQSLVTVDTGIRLRDDMVKLETRNIPNIFWDYKYDLEESAMRNESIRSSGQQPKSPFRTNLQRPRGKWTAKISHSISVDSRLLPNFCSSIVARLYTVILRVKVSGIRKESFDLEVPLQVVHTSQDTESSEAALDSAATAEPVGEDLSLLEFRRASATSWLSDESLGMEELPPSYHR